MAAEKKSESPQPSAPGKFRAAWSVLRGQRLVPLQVQAEWLTYQQIFDDVLTRLGAQLARQAKSRSDELKRHLKEHPEQLQLLDESVLPLNDLQERKNALRHRFAQHRAPQLAFRSSSSAQPLAAPPEESP